MQLSGIDVLQEIIFQQNLHFLDVQCFEPTYNLKNKVSLLSFIAP